MTDLASARKSLTEARRAWEEARSALFTASEARRALELEVAQVRRSPGHSAGRLKELERRRAEVERTLAARAAELEQAGTRKGEAEQAFASFTDPRVSVASLGDQTPFLLLPVRIETRFKVVESDAGAQNQLWVRVYPDDCLVDGFEPLLSVSELASARRYWIDWWRAGGTDAGRRSAWRALVASHGSGRAAWIVAQFRPANPGEEPVKAAEPDVVLVVAAESPLDAAEVGPVATYWEAVWRAAGDAALLAAAFDALVQRLGAARAAEIQAQYQPVNPSENPVLPFARSQVEVQVGFLWWPPAPPTQQDSWSRAPQARVLPDRLLFLGYQAGQVIEQLGAPISSPLTCGPDPSAPADQQLRAEDGELRVPEEMRWMVDFERAVETGMGFRIALDPVQARMGFDRIVVLGVRLAGDADQSRLLLEEHLAHLQASGLGMSLLAQGTPTNNTDATASGYSPADDSDVSYADVLRQGDLIVPNSDPDLRSDGEWLAEALGIDPSVLNHTHGADGTDQLEARALNTALWPGTLGYFMETLMHPLFGPEDVEGTRRFFTRFVSGRGALPALRIGRQPYGIVPTTAFSRLSWEGAGRPGAAATPGLAGGFLTRLTGLLQRIGADWSALVAQVSRVGTPSAERDPHQVLLDVIGLHPSSVEYHQRYVEGRDHLYNVLNLDGAGDAWLGGVDREGGIRSAVQLLARLGFAGAELPDLFQMRFLSRQNRLQGPVIDDRPLSERDAIRAYTADGHNYLEWLRTAALTSLETLRLEAGFRDDQPPTALLYLCLRHALLLSFWRAGISLAVAGGVLDAGSAKARNREAPFIHVRGDAAASESRWLPLYSADARITGDPAKLVSEYIVEVLGTSPSAATLDQQIQALGRLARVPTARLERAFAEHLDCCTYRLDAWMLGLASCRLAGLREAAGGTRTTTRGIYLGVYGYLHDVRSEHKELAPVTLPANLEPIFGGADLPPLVRDSTNGGYVIAPSLNHAVTAAVLRNGYLANASAATSEVLAVDLSSARVRVAMAFLEGMRGGQSLGALLGYRLERALHDAHQVAEVDAFILALRREFPLAANKLVPTVESDPNVPIEALEARNVVDGLSLVEHVRTSGNGHYPFGKTLPAATAAQASAIDSAVADLVDVHDAIADLGLAESVHQAVQGNFERAAGSLDSFGRGNYPPDPDVVRTPHGGHQLTQRLALHLETGVSTTSSPVAGVAMTPRARSAAAVNRWLAGMLPPPDGVACRVSYFDQASNAVREATVTQADLGLQPIDLLYLLQVETAQAMGELDDRVVRRIVSQYGPRPDADIRIRYTEPISGMVTFFEASPLVRHLRGLLLKSRPLRATDLALGGEADRADDATATLDRGLAASAAVELGSLRDDVVQLRDAIRALPPGVDGFSSELAHQLDGLATQLVGLLERGSRYGLPGTGWGFVLQGKQAQFASLFALVEDRVTRWSARLDRFDQFVDVEYPALPATSTSADKLALLRRAEAEISTQVASLNPLTPELLLADLMTRRGGFAQKLAALQAVLSTNATTIGALYDAVAGLLPLDAFDRQPLDLGESRKAMVDLVADLLRRAVALATDLTSRIAKVTGALTDHDATADPARRVLLMTSALKSVFGDDFLVVPEFTLSSEGASEVAAAVADSRADALLRHAVTLHDFPCDDWLYGVARVRPRVRDWEQALHLAGALGGTEPALVPIQLPYRPGDYWLGLEFPTGPQGYVLDGGRLLYTAHLPAPLDPGGRCAGLLLDEWTEVLPAAEETVGVTFHYDRPNCEAPQSLLLVVPPALTGSWRFQDLVDAVNETFALARTRAVEPAQLDGTPYATFLPAFVMAATLHPITIGTALAVNNRYAGKAVLRG